MICGIGTDICEIARWENSHFSQRLLTHCFTPEEQEYIRSRGKASAQTAAGLFCAKESFLKALGLGLGSVPLTDIVIRHTGSGQPFYAPAGKAESAATALGCDRMHLSISHDGGFAVAFCVLSKEE